MKYFTRELIEMGQAHDDAILHHQAELWDEACVRYFSQLDALKNAMPAGLRQRVDNYYLHDAVIRGMGQRGHSFIIMLQLDTPPESLLTLTYELVQDPVIDRAALAPEHCSTSSIVDWQYDETEQIAGEPATWAQTILFGNGWEVRLHFRDMRVEEAQALIPTPRGECATGIPPACAVTE